MSTDFFERQDRAHRLTGRLLVAFVLAVLAMAALLYGLALAIYSGLAHFGLVVPLDTWLAPMILVLVFTLTVAAAGGASLMRWMDLSAGGPAVARLLGAKMIDLDTRVPDERRLLNIVDEMSLAAACPAPVVYVLPSEWGINALTAGYSLDDAVICVTRGALERLDRDELSAIIAHEFSHILNGDAKLNTALISSLHGFFSLNLMGQGVVDKIISLCSGTASDGRDTVVMWLILIAILPF
ncbi:MAG TPA: M48 family metalloprotease, partial [Pirellulales bacterium]